MNIYKASGLEMEMWIPVESTLYRITPSGSPADGDLHVDDCNPTPQLQRLFLLLHAPLRDQCLLTFFSSAPCGAFSVFILVRKLLLAVVRRRWKPIYPSRQTTHPWALLRNQPGDVDPRFNLG